MKVIIVLGLVVLVIGVSYSQQWMEDPEEQYGDENSFIDSLDMDKRDMLMKLPKCMFNTMPCIPNSNRRFARCCRGLTCGCNFFGANCKCRRKMTG